MHIIKEEEKKCHFQPPLSLSTMLATAAIKMTIDITKNIDSTASISARVGKSRILYLSRKTGFSKSLQFSTKQRNPLDRLELCKI